MQLIRPKLLASSCVVAACLLPAGALAAEPTAAQPPAKAGAPSSATPQPQPASQPQPAQSPAPAAAEPAAPPSPEVLLEAKQRFDRGFELYEEGEYSLALIEFNRAYELVPNYRVLYNIGQVCIQLGQYANARRALEEYLAKGGDELAADRRTAVNKDLEMLGHRTAFLTIGANVESAEVLVDDTLVGKTPLGPALLVDAGVHRVSVRRVGYLPKTTSVTLAGGDEKSLSIALELQPEEKTIVVREREVEEDNSTTWMVAGWVTTGALAAGAIVTGIMGAGEADELDKLKGGLASDYDGELPKRLEDAKSNAQTLFLVSDVLTGAAVVVGGLSLWITLDRPEPSRPAETPPQQPALQVGYERGQLQLRGSF
jgi:tetratricopeptide (TPR) repeat protein